MYTNKTASNFNFKLYSKLVGGNKCVKHCKKKCKDKCRGVCKTAYDDTEQHDEEYTKLEKKLKGLIQKLEDVKAEKLKKLKSVLDPAARYTRYDNRFDRYRYRGGRRTRKRRTRKGGLSFFGNTSHLSDCEDGRNNNCSDNCNLLCDNAISMTTKHKEKVDALKKEIKLHEQLIEMVESKN